MNRGSWESTWSWAKLRLLVVDDAPTIRRLIGDWLENDGHYVETAADGLQGLEKFKTGTWDLVITDREMPELNGDALATAIKKIKPTLPVLLITGSSDQGHGPRGEGSLFDLIIPKPLTRDLLRGAIASFRLRADE